jgi:hypothetical protein
MIGVNYQIPKARFQGTPNFQLPNLEQGTPDRNYKDIGRQVKDAFKKQ